MAKTIINWEAEEYIDRNRGSKWYVGLAIVVAILLGIAILFKDWWFVAVIIVATIALLAYVLRKPRILHYSLSSKGLSEGNNLYAFSDFKSFGILNEANHYSIILTPKKRFGSRVSVFFPEAQGEEIVDMFGACLPMEPVKLDAVDKLIRFLHI